MRIRQSQQHCASCNYDRRSWQVAMQDESRYLIHLGLLSINGISRGRIKHWLRRLSTILTIHIRSVTADVVIIQIASQAKAFTAILETYIGKVIKCSTVVLIHAAHGMECQIADMHNTHLESRNSHEVKTKIQPLGSHRDVNVKVYEALVADLYVTKI